MYLIFSENKIFGKYDAFCKRLAEIRDLLTTLDGLDPILPIRAEGIEPIVSFYKDMLASMNDWVGDPTEPRNKQVRLK